MTYVYGFKDTPCWKLSLARTALDEDGDIARAIDLIDEVMGSLEYNGGSGNDNLGEAAWVAATLRGSCQTFSDEMSEESRYEDHDPETARRYKDASKAAIVAIQALGRAVQRLSL